MNKRMMTRALIGATAVTMMGTAGYAVSFSGSALNDFRNTDTDNGGTISQSSSNVRNMTFNVSTSRRSRAEIRRNGQKSGRQIMGGNFKVKSADSGADRISVIQALTVNASNAQTGSATVATQLIVRRSGSSWKFYVNQDQSSPCFGGRSVSTGTSVPLQIFYENGKRPTYRAKFGGRWYYCTKGSVNLGGNNRYYYGKLGAYLTTSGSGKASIEWRNIFD